MVNDLSLQVYYCATDALGKKRRSRGDPVFFAQTIFFSPKHLSISSINLFISRITEFAGISIKKKHISSFYICLDFKASVGYCVG